jgi:cell division initiation protein
MSEQFQFPEVGFSKSFRGYQVDEVESYVDDLRREFAYLVDKNNALEKEISRMRELESSLLRAMQLAEEAQKTWQVKVEAEAKSIQEKSVKEAERLVADAKKEAEKIKFLADSERKSLLATASQELKVQERGLIGLQEAQKEIANQLAQIAQSTLTRIQSWNTSVPAPEKAETNAPKPVIRKTNVVEKSKVPSKSSPKSAKASNTKSTKTAKATTTKKITEKKLSSKDMEIQDDGLPSLNKVLEAYAKSTGPRGKVGDIN